MARDIIICVFCVLNVVIDMFNEGLVSNKAL